MCPYLYSRFAAAFRTTEPFCFFLFFHSRSFLFLMIAPSEKLLVDLSCSPDALTEIDKVPEDLCHKNKAGINECVQWSVPKFPMVRKW